MSAVLDASFLAAALIRTQQRPAAVAMLRGFAQAGEPLFAPNVVQSEFVSAVRRLERRGELTRLEADITVRSFRRLALIPSWDDQWVERALEIARAIDASTIYDALYLACAEALDCQFYTCDAAFCRAFGDGLPARVSLVL